jgi:nicotinamidase-related amidase
MRALIIIDMLNDFVDGQLANPKAQAIIEPLQRLLAQAREEGWVVVFSNDAHQPGDPEMRVWGEHAMAGTPGADVIPQLEPAKAIAPSATTAPRGTRLDEQLTERGVDQVVIAGQHTHICVRHCSPRR